MPFIPHTPEDIADMLAVIGAPSIDALFDEIPAGLIVPRLDGVPTALTEMEIGRLMSERASADGRPLNFVGAGAYEHHIPAPVWAIATRGEFYSAYTPYQAEASQGTLQLIYEYQSMLCALTGMEVSNASLYDGASGLAEACLMAIRANRASTSRRILMPRSVNPTYADVARAIAGNQEVGFESVDVGSSGCTQVDALRAYDSGDFAALVIQQPNFFGNLEDVDALTDWAHRNGILVIAVVNPLSLAVLKPPSEWGEATGKSVGADIVCGEGQPFGIPLASGGPYFGFMATRTLYARQMPGRIVGRTVDVDGRPGFTLTLQAREQHIRRSKATSNICTNQGLMVTAATIYLSLLGATGLASVAGACMRRTAELVSALTRTPHVRVAFAGNGVHGARVHGDRVHGDRVHGDRFHEALLVLDRPVAPVLAALQERGILGGLDVSQLYPQFGHGLLVCATETKTSADIEHYASALEEILHSSAGSVDIQRGAA